MRRTLDGHTSRWARRSGQRSKANELDDFALALDHEYMKAPAALFATWMRQEAIARASYGERRFIRTLRAGKRDEGRTPLVNATAPQGTYPACSYCELRHAARHRIDDAR